ncbi:hypothetical protein [Burkholderia gladioli]|uniref:hypothetical protein n=1 Tax=Burkholderia gladioli TaxID=28095 RepID=UPI001C5EE6ED|nr:hypothetical protein [Burkholderia gladioli]MBW5284191.1 hypothetical protein [Burkholderia gladioli]
MFTDAKRELKELIALVDQLAREDATRAARPDIVPGEGYDQSRRSRELRSIALMEKYELQDWNRR